MDTATQQSVKILAELLAIDTKENINSKLWAEYAEKKIIELMLANPIEPLVMRPEWVRAIAKAASSLRFTADQWDWMKPAARKESHSIADLLTEIENEYIQVKHGD